MNNPDQPDEDLGAGFFPPDHTVKLQQPMQPRHARPKVNHVPHRKDPQTPEERKAALALLKMRQQALLHVTQLLKDMGK